MTRMLALVTGAGRGLGAVIAAGLFEAGYAVALTDVDAERAESQAHGLDPSGERALGLKLDVRDKSAFVHALEILCTRWGGVGVLVNNAAVTRTTAVFEIEPAEFDDVLAVNLKGVFLGCQVFGAHFARTGYGRIINMASLAGQNGGAATGAHYAASKGAILTLTKVFARELAGKGVTVNAIAPGPLDVPLIHEIIPPQRLAGLVAAIPVGCLGDPAFIARIVCLLAAPEAASVTGATIDANGGLHVR